MAVKKAKPAENSSGKEIDSRIAERAYEIFLERIKSGKPGDAASDWAAAEAELSGGKKK